MELIRFARKLITINKFVKGLFIALLPHPPSSSVRRTPFCSVVLKLVYFCYLIRLEIILSLKAEIFEKIVLIRTCFNKAELIKLFFYFSPNIKRYNFRVRLLVEQIRQDFWSVGEKVLE